MNKNLIQNSINYIILGLAVTFVVAVIVLHAWVNDDAYITFRVVDNFINGYGLRWNVVDRVQVFTHPLWLLLTSSVYFFTREAYLTSLGISWFLALVILWVLVKIFKDYKIAALAIFILGLSTAFVDYSTSGLENSLGHLIAVVFIWCYISFPEISQKQRLFYLSLISSLALITRHDYILLFAPVLLLQFLTAAKQFSLKVAFKTLFLGMIPFVAWEIFSIIYFGFPFPNTFYAKTQNFLVFTRSVAQALHYYEYTLIYDPLTLIVIFLGAILGLFNQKTRPLSIGIALYLIYIISVGGDFMGGRFFSVPYIISLVVMILGMAEILKRWNSRVGQIIVVISFTAVVGWQIFSAKSPTFLPYAKGFEIARYFNVSDQRMVYYPTSFLKTDEIHDYWIKSDYSILNKTKAVVKLLLQGEFHRTEITHDFIEKGNQFRLESLNGDYQTPPIISAAGFIGYYSGPEVHLIDRLALGDAFLSHLPPINRSFWKPGHYERYILPDYVYAIQYELDNIENPASVDPLYQQIQLITKAPLFQRDRIKAIIILNLQPKYSLLSPETVLFFRFPNAKEIDAGEWMRFSSLGIGDPLWIENDTGTIELQMTGNKLFIVEELLSNGARLNSTTIECEIDLCSQILELKEYTRIVVVYPTQGYHWDWSGSEIEIKYRSISQ